jgi:ATP-binding cassette, subfamily B, bacterial
LFYRDAKGGTILIQKLRSANTILAQLLKTFSLVWAASRYWTVAWMGLLLVQGLLPAISITLTRQVVDNLVRVAGAGLEWANIQELVLPIGIMALILIVGEGCNGTAEWVRTVQAELVHDHVSQLIQQKSVEVDYSFYENSEYNDKLNRAREGASGRSLSMLESTGRLLQDSVTLFAIAAVLITYGLWLPIIVMVSAFPAFYVLLYLNRLHYEWSQRTTTDRRWLIYYDQLLTSSSTAAEVRLFDFAEHFQALYQQLRRRLRREQIKLLQLQTLGRFAATIIVLLISGVILAWMGRQVLLGILTLGDLALFFQAFNQAQSLIKTLLSNLGQIYRNSLFIGNLFEFLQIPSKVLDPQDPSPIPAPIQREIRFNNVTFCYPGTDTPVLANFDLVLPAGKVIAIVGDNGAGKSTLIKLLCRFYDPQGGRLEVDGIDLRRFAVKAWRRQITALFQSYIPYSATAKQNIALGNIALGNIAADASFNQIKAAAAASGIHEKITQLPQDYDTLLGKLFPNATDLSGGQWQRLALARAFFRQAQLIILDEPTSAMDPWAEHDWLERFRKLAQGRTAVVITHRFTLAMRADVIHVMRAGQIVESGSHEALLKQDGLYAESWRSQMQIDSNLLPL